MLTEEGVVLSTEGMKSAFENLNQYPGFSSNLGLLLTLPCPMGR